MDINKNIVWLNKDTAILLLSNKINNDLKYSKSMKKSTDQLMKYLLYLYIGYQ